MQHFKLGDWISCMIPTEAGEQYLSKKEVTNSHFEGKHEFSSGRADAMPVPIQLFPIFLLN